MNKYVKMQIVSLIAAILSAMISASGLFFGDVSYLPFPLIAGLVFALLQKEDKSYKFLPVLLVGSAVYGLVAMLLIIFQMFITTQSSPLGGMPLSFLFQFDQVVMAVLLAFVAFLGGLGGIVIKGLDALYPKRVKTILIAVGPLALTAISFFYTRLDIGGTVLSRYYGWPRPFLILRIKDVLDGSVIRQWIFSPGSLYHYIIFDYLFYLAILLAAWGIIKGLNKFFVKHKFSESLIIFFVIILTALPLYLSSEFKEIKISRSIQAANYCRHDADCALAGSQCPFGCAIYVNQKEQARVSSMINEFDSNCVYGCVDCPAATCEWGKCQPLCDSGAVREKIGDAKYEVAEVLSEPCYANEHCQLPFDYAIRSNCPYEAVCLDQHCAVICPEFGLPAEDADWLSFKQAILNCEVEQLFQAHSLEVGAQLKDGTSISAREPGIDDVFTLADSVLDKCGQPIMATE